MRPSERAVDTTAPTAIPHELFRWVLLRWSMYTTMAFLCIAVATEVACRLQYNRSVLRPLWRGTRLLWADFKLWFGYRFGWLCGYGRVAMPVSTDVVLIGLPASGKSSLLYWLASTANTTTAPGTTRKQSNSASRRTVISSPSLTATQLVVGGTRLTSFTVRPVLPAAPTTDVTPDAMVEPPAPGNDGLTAAMKPYFARAAAVLVIVDSRDPLHLRAVDLTLQSLFGTSELTADNATTARAAAWVLPSAPLLILSNFTDDNERSLPPPVITEALGLELMTSRLTQVAPVVATTYHGVFRAFQWLSTAIRETVESRAAANAQREKEE